MSFGLRIVTSVLSILLFGAQLGIARNSYQQQDLAQIYIDDKGPQGRLDYGIPNFQKTTDVIYRGGRPTLKGLQYLKTAGFKTIINLENNNQAVSQEFAAAKKLGLQMYSAPMSWTTKPDDKQVNAILANLQNPEMYPIFIHCHHGMDRTGLIIGLHRVFAQKWTAKDAYSEMLKYGFHPEYKALDNYYRVKTQMR